MASLEGKIGLKFGWQGPQSIRGGVSKKDGLEVRVVDLLFQNAKTQISVNIPEKISPTVPRQLPFTCRRDSGETTPDTLSLKMEQIRNLTLIARFFEESPTFEMDSNKVTEGKQLVHFDEEIKLKIPNDLEIGNKYMLVMTLKDCDLTAALVKEEVLTPEQKTDYQQRVQNFGAGLIQEGLNNLKLAANGGRPVFDSSSTNSDVLAHMMQGIIHVGQETMSPAFQVPHGKPNETPADLNKLSVKELQDRFSAAILKDKQIEVSRWRESLEGDIQTMNQIMQEELVQSQLVGALADALERKGVRAQIPDSQEFRLLEAKAADLQRKAVVKIQQNLRKK